MQDDIGRHDAETETGRPASHRERRSQATQMRRRGRAPRRVPRWPIALVAAVAVAAASWGAWTLLKPKDTSTPVLASPPSAGRVTARPNATLVSGINDFGFELLRRSLDANTDSPSVVLSPLSVHSMLAMTECGATGATSERMRAALGVDSMKSSAARQAYADLLVGLAQSQKNHLVLANSVWLDDINGFKQSFLDTDRLYFGAEARAVDLQSQPGVNEINWWVSKNTGDRIVRMLGEPLPSTTSIELFGAAYYLGTWGVEFDPRSTKPADFHVAGGPAIKTNMMRVTGEFEYTKSKTLQAIRLRYKDAPASALVILPSESNSLPRLLSSLSAKRLTQIRRSLKTSPGTFSMPRLDSRNLVDLREPLSALGLADVFSSSHAEFQGMVTKPPAWIDRVRHSTYLHLDEHGTEADSARAIQASASPTSAPKPFTMTADRPYLLVIVDDKSGAMIFAAAIRDPRG